MLNVYSYNSILVHLLTAVFHAADLMLAVDLKTAFAIIVP